MSDPREQLRPALRPDLGWVAQSDARGWVVEDPVSANFFMLSELEHIAALTMNGKRGLLEIKRELCRRFPALGIDLAWIEQLLAKLQTHYLLVADPKTDARRAPAARDARRLRGLTAPLMSPLAIRIPLFDPSSFLRGLALPARLLFHPWTVVFGLSCALLAVYLVVRELLISPFNLSAELQAISGDRLIVLGASYLVAKSLHELGHGMACTYHRTECREVGVMLLCLAPCLYCDTTDAWRLPSRWRRAGIAAAGIYVEIVLATLAAAVWLATVDGTVHFVAASMMLVCSVGTVLVNSNPLLRYDGYFILSDLWGIPNLAEQSRASMRALAASYFTGKRIDARRFPANVWLLAAYGIASGAYRIFVLGLILLICWHVLVPLGLGLVAMAVTASVLLGLALSYTRSARMLWTEVKAGQKLRTMRALLAVCLLFAGVAFLFQFEFPSSIYGRGVTDYQDKLPIFASQAAEVVYVAPTGQRIEQGKSILKLQNPESELELTTLAGEIALLRQELEQLEMRRAIDLLAPYQIPARQEKLNELESREVTLIAEANALSQLAPFPGFFFVGNETIQPSLTAVREDRFVARPTDLQNFGCWVERGSLLGWFSPKQSIVISAVLPDEAVRKLEIGLPAEVRWDSSPAVRSTGQIIRISSEATIETPRELVGDPRIVSTRDTSGRLRPEMPHYEVTIRVDCDYRPPKGSPVSVRIPTESLTLFEQAAAAIKKNLKPIY